MKSLNIAYFGSSYFSASLLEQILIDKELPVKLKFVVTQPDQPVGRKQILTPTPVKIMAEKYFKSEDIKFFAVCGFPSKNFDIELKNIDIALVYAFGEVIPKNILSLPKYGFWNIHPSLLPKYRGPSPIAIPLINGDETTGVTIIKMDEEIDHGPIIAQQSLTIEKTDKRPDLEKKLTNLGFEMFKKIVGERTKFFATWDIPLGEGSHGDKKIRSEPFIAQNHKLATYTKKLTKQDGFVEISKLKDQISKNSEELFNLFRGLYPWPGIWTILPNGKRLKITGLNIVRNKNLCSLQIKRVQLEGKKEVDFETFKRAYKMF